MHLVGYLYEELYVNSSVDTLTLPWTLYVNSAVDNLR
jgi:hypothetical protein